MVRLWISLLSLYIILALPVNVESRAARNEDDKCRLSRLALQDDFDIKKFQGSWYGTFTTGMDSSILSYFMEIYDMRGDFILNREGNYDIKAIGSKFYGSWCPKGKGHAVMPDRRRPEKMTMFFDTTVGRKIGMKPAWILKTDYDNYAIIYSCWLETNHDSCDESRAYAAVLQRKTTALPSSLRAEVDTAINGACINSRKLKPVTHYGYCSGEPEL